MSILKRLFGLRHHKVVKESVIKELFLFERSTLITLMLLETILLYILIPLIGNGIAAWYGIIATLTLWRLYDAYVFKKSPNRYSIITWHKQFVVKAWLTAFLLSSLSLFVVPQLNEYYQLFIFIMLIGISAGAVKTLSDDYRTAIGYLLILLVPTSLEMLLLQRSDTYILAFLMILYFFTQTSIILNAYGKNLELERKKEELFEKEEIIDLFFEQAPVGILSYDNDLNITDCNQSFLSLFDVKKEKTVSTKLSHFVNDTTMGMLIDSLQKGAITSTGSFETLKKMKFRVEGKYSPIFNKEGNIIGGMALLEDKTTEYKALEELMYQASHDSLTSLSNRRGFDAFMHKMIKSEKHMSHFSLLLYLDINQFKHVNDSLGHSCGDDLLIEIAKRLTNVTEEHQHLTRLGGDEFLIVVPFVSQRRDHSKDIAAQYAEVIQESFVKPFIIGGIRLHIKTSIGIVMIEPDSCYIDEIVRYADIAMYKAKKEGYEYISYYNSQLDDERKKMFDLYHDFVSALHNDQLELYFQPILNIKDDSLRAAEALIRWNHPEKGLIAPMDFIPLAIESGGITDMSWWVLDKVCSTIVQWKKQGEWNLNYVSININAKQLIIDDFAETFIAKLKSYGVQSSDVNIEITETSLIDNFEITQKVIKQLQSYGLKCAIDDFGTGYSSLSYLKKLSFSILKIDREFTHDMLSNEDSMMLVKSIVEIGKQFNYNITVEGIEDRVQKQVIKDLDDSLSYQGFLISHPIPEVDFRKKFLKS